MSETGSSDFDKNLLIQVRNELLATVEKKEEKEEPLMIPTVPMGENGMGEKNTAIVYFFHGSGSSGASLEKWLKELCKENFAFPHIKVIFPDAPNQPYQLNANRDSRVWFDRDLLKEESNEKKESVNKICAEMLKRIEEEATELGIPYNRIIVGGFSMGGALALHLAYRFNKPFAGCFTISSFLNHDSLVYEALKENCESTKPQLLQLHGRSDVLVPFEPAGGKLRDAFKEKGVDVITKKYTYADHEIVKEEVVFLKEWILSNLPPT